MHRRDILGISMAMAVTLLPAAALAQQKSMKDQLVGAWTLLLADGVKSDGTQVPLYGPNPIGLMILTPNGRSSSQLMRTVNRAPFKSNNRDTGTADENKAAVQGTLSFFGNYTVDEAGKSFTVNVEGSTFPNWEGKPQKYQVTSLTDDVLTFTLPGTASTIPGAGYAALQIIWRKVK